MRLLATFNSDRHPQTATLSPREAYCRMVLARGLGGGKWPVSQESANGTRRTVGTMQVITRKTPMARPAAYFDARPRTASSIHITAAVVNRPKGIIRNRR